MALQARGRRPSARTTRVSARRIGAGPGADRDRTHGVRQGEEAREGLAAKRASVKRLRSHSASSKELIFSYP